MEVRPAVVARILARRLGVGNRPRPGETMGMKHHPESTPSRRIPPVLLNGRPGAPDGLDDGGLHAVKQEFGDLGSPAGSQERQ